jgi:hypothetical protein
MDNLTQSPILSAKIFKVATLDSFDGSQQKTDTFATQLSLYFHGKRIYDVLKYSIMQLH